MATTTTVETVFNGLRKQAVHITGIQTDLTGESAVQKVDISALTRKGQVATYSTIDCIEFKVSPGMYVLLEWDHTANDEIAYLTGHEKLDWSSIGGKTDPQSAGGTGDILLTSAGAGGALAAGDGYDITIYFRPKN